VKYFKGFADNPYIPAFLRSISVAPASLQTAADILRVLTTRVPGLSHLQEADYNTVMEQINYDTPLYTATVGSLEGDARTGFDELIVHLTYFAPPGYHNSFITRLIEQFELDDVPES